MTEAAREFLRTFDALSPADQAEVTAAILGRAASSGALSDEALSALAELEHRNGFDVFPERAGPMATVESVQQLGREEGI